MKQNAPQKFSSENKGFNITHINEVGLSKTKSQRVKSLLQDLDPTSLMSKINDKALSDAFMKLMREHNELVGQLQATQEQLAEKDKSLALISKTSKLNPLDMTDTSLQFAFLFSSPLVRNANGVMNSVMQLDCMSEIEDILESLKKLEYNMKYKV